MVKQIYESCKEKKIRKALANLVKASYSSSSSDIDNEESDKYSNVEMNDEVQIDTSSKSKPEQHAN